MKAWQPVLTASTVLPIFFLTAVVFLPLGITLLVSSNGIREKIIEYTDNDACRQCITKDEGITSPDQNKFLACKCEIKFKLNEKWDGDIYFYYGLDNFYQNHRRYVRSRDDAQLHGKLSDKVSPNCAAPFDKGLVGNSTHNETRPIVPCGAVANSMFTDVFTLYHASDLSTTVPLTSTGISWKSDRETKFKNPSPISKLDTFAKPKDWNIPISALDNQMVNEDFIVWMRVAAFPTFRKLYRKLDTSSQVNKNYQDGLIIGEYTLKIDYNYPVKSFGGKKKFIITTASWIGGKNSFLGTCYTVVGALCLVFGFVFLFIHKKHNKGNSR